ncbi:MAG: chemotaxis protein CheD [Candidatus Cloacimonadota bacterium]|nr:MAG: chemotaxis protein CheD [Candidatus Cloacimonadota bacterium]
MGKLTLGIGEAGTINKPGEIIETLALGSCVAIILMDPKTHCVGMVHCALPDSKLNREKAEKLPGYFVDTGIPYVLKLMKNLVAPNTLGKIIVKLAGGACVADKNKVFNIGKRNILTTKKLLWKYRLGAIAEDVGGSHSRSVVVEVDSGRVILKSPGLQDKEL